MFSKLLITILTCTIILILGTNIATGQDTIPPTINITDSQIYANFRLGESDVYINRLNDDTLKIELTCLFYFPDEYFFDIGNATIEDDYGISQDTIIVDSIVYDEIGYGTVFQTIIAEDYFGNTSKYVIISTLSYLYDFDFLGLDVGDIQVFYDEGSYSLDNNYFEFCQVEKINIEAFTHKNGCTGKAKINWIINDFPVEPVNKFEDIISIDINELKPSNTVEIVANFNNTKFGDTISFNIQKTVANTEVQNPTCSNSADGIIELDPSVVQAIWGHSDSDALYLNNLEAGTYYVSYIIPNEYSYCEFYDTITLVHENTLDFTISDTTIDLSKNETLTIKNNSNIAGEFLWQIGDSIFINNANEFDFAFKSPGNYEILLTDNSSNCNDMISKNILVEGTLAVADTIAPKVIIDWSLLINYPDLNATMLSDDTLEVRPSCKYRFPGEYYFGDIVFFEDDSAIYRGSNYETIYDDNGYGTVIETIIAEDNSGNRTRFVIKSTIGDIYPFNFLGLDLEGGQLGNLYVPYLSNTFSLDQTDFVLCEDSKIDITANTSKNGCTGNSNMKWYIDDRNVSSDPDKISIDLSQQNDSFMVAIEAYFSNTNFQDKVSFNIQKASAQTEIQNPTCANSMDGSIKLDSRIFGAMWEHTDSDALFLDSLETGTYKVSYWFNDCNINETITLFPENYLDFTVSDSVINLSQNELLTIRNLTNNIGESLWQIGDSTFINNENEFDYAFKLPGKYKIKLTDNSGFCNESIFKDIIVEGTTSVHDNPVSSIKIGPNPFSDFLNIDLGKSADYEITIFGVDGSACFKDQFRDIRNIEVDLNFLAPGLYVLEIASLINTELIKSFKIVKSDY